MLQIFFSVPSYLRLTNNGQARESKRSKVGLLRGRKIQEVARKDWLGGDPSK